MKNSIKIVSRAWAPGDLVKISKTRWDGVSSEALGVVIYEIDNPQQKIFPAVYVFDTQAGEPREFYVYDLELISAAV